MRKLACLVRGAGLAGFAIAVASCGGSGTAAKGGADASTKKDGPDKDTAVTVESPQDAEVIVTGSDAAIAVDDAGIIIHTIFTAPDAAAALGCATPHIQIVFPTMYSAYDSVHHFQIPAVVNGIDPSVITWSALDPTMVDLQEDTTTGGVLITTRKAGVTSIIANAGGLCGSASITIAAATNDDWLIGSARYNDGVVLTRLPGGGVGRGPKMPTDEDAGIAATEYACTNCHGDAANGLYKTVQHTPEQTGGFSDADLLNIFIDGIVPKGGYFDATIVTYARWRISAACSRVLRRANATPVRPPRRARVMKRFFSGSRTCFAVLSIGAVAVVSCGGGTQQNEDAAVAADAAFVDAFVFKDAAPEPRDLAARDLAIDARIEDAYVVPIDTAPLLILPLPKGCENDPTRRVKSGVAGEDEQAHGSAEHRRLRAAWADATSRAESVANT